MHLLLLQKQKYETMATTANENLMSSSGKLPKEKIIKVAPYTLVQIYIDQCRIFTDWQMF